DVNPDQGHDAAEAGDGGVGVDRAYGVVGQIDGGRTGCSTEIQRGVGVDGGAGVRQCAHQVEGVIAANAVQTKRADRIRVHDDGLKNAARRGLEELHRPVAGVRGAVDLEAVADGS